MGSQATNESQRLMDVPQQRRCSLINLIKLRILPTLRSVLASFFPARGEDQPPMEDTFCTNIKCSDLYDFPGENVPMSPEIFSALSEGKKEWLTNVTSTPIAMACLKSYGGDSVLHVAAAYGHLGIVKEIVSACPCLLILEPNSRDQLPLHVAARAGHLAVVKALVLTLTTVSARKSEEDMEIPNLYVMKDKNGNTPLHLALKGSHGKTVDCLLKAEADADKQALLLENEDEKSPLYLAVEAGFVSHVKAMLNKVEIFPNDGREGRKNLVHAALKAKNMEILDVILEKYRQEYPILDEKDKEGMTCLSFGASIGFYDGVCKLLDRSPKNVYVCNEDGSFPIHIAVEKCHSRVFREILKRCPDSLYLLNRKDQNIFHIAAKSGKTAKFFFLYFWKYHLLTENQDVDGNTPLHLATINWRPRTLFYLSVFGRRKSKYTRNNDGLTAQDIAESTIQPNYVFRERMTFMVLLYFTAYSLHPRMLFKMIKIPSSRPPAGEKNKDYINILLVVAALIAAVTFAAGFTVPGGFHSNGPQLGRAILASNSKLVKFMIFDILAMQSSIVTICTLIWAQLGDPAFVHRSLNLALPSLFFSLICMAAAFYCGVLVAFANVKAFVIFVNVAAAIFFFIMLVLLGPHVSLHTPGSSLILLGPYFMLFLMLVDESSDEQLIKKKSSDEQVLRIEFMIKSATKRKLQLVNKKLKQAQSGRRKKKP